MTKRNPDKREQKRLKRIEEDKKGKRYIVAQSIVEGGSIRQAAKKVQMSTAFVIYWRDRLLDRKTRYVPRKGHRDPVPVYHYVWKEDWKDLIGTRKPGPAPGNCPKVEAIKEKVAEQKRKPFCGDIGAAKIGLMAGVDASAPTVMKALKKMGFKPVREQPPRHLKRYCREAPNEQWNIDFVEVGVDSTTGKKVESLSVTDDHSRYSFSNYATTEATTDNVIQVLTGLMTEYGKPRIINSDHGTQWYSTSSGSSRFDAWCEEQGIEHRLAPIRVPELNGKVERYHGCLRAEAALPESASVGEYRAHLEEYRRFFNEQRPNCSLDYRRPEEVYNKTEHCQIQMAIHDLDTSLADKIFD